MLKRFLSFLYHKSSYFIGLYVTSVYSRQAALFEIQAGRVVNILPLNITFLCRCLSWEDYFVLYSKPPPKDWDSWSANFEGSPSPYPTKFVVYKFCKEFQFCFFYFIFLLDVLLLWGVHILSFTFRSILSWFSYLLRQFSLAYDTMRK